MSRLPVLLTEAVIEKLKTRKGFDAWWDHLDPILKDDITETAADHVARVLMESELAW